MRRAPAVAALVALLAACVGAWAWALGRPARAADAALTRVRQRGYLIAGVALWTPPFSAPGREGGWDGLDVALAREVASAIFGNPAKVHLLPLAPGERLWAVRSGAADIVVAGYAAGASTAAPAGVALVGPYFDDQLGMLVRRGRPVRSWRQLDGAVVGVVPGSGAGPALRAAVGPAATPVLESVGGLGVAARDVANGRLRALVGGLATCRALAAYDPALTVQPLAGSERYWALTAAGAGGLQAAVRQGIEALPRGSALAAALSRWSRAPEAPRPPTPPPLTPPRSAA